jgi:glycosyltransferase involved in cell wall biosynthesis
MRLVLDVSTASAWRRPPVGIVRTEREFAAFLLDRAGPEVSFCRFDRSTARHVEVPSEVVRGYLGWRSDEMGHLAPPDPAADNSATIGTGPRPRRARRLRRSVSSAFESGIARLPASLQGEASIVVRSGGQLVKGLYWLALKTWREAVPWPARRRYEAMPQPAGKERELLLGPDDVYVSMGLDWEYNDLAVLCRLKRRQGFRTILYCYDLIPVRFPQLMSFDARQPFAKYFVDLAHVADHVVTISRATRDDYRNFLVEVGAPIPPLSVIELGTDITMPARGRGEPPRPDLVQEPFVLCVGTIEARKNHELLYNVWDRLVARHGQRAPRLVLVGMVGWGVHDLLSRIQLNRELADKIIILQNVPDDALSWLYEHCLFTVFPSLFEGWGLPVVESLALGKPCITSNARAVAEAARGLVPTLDPLDFPAWLQHIERWAFDADAVEASARRLRDYRAPSWRDHGEAMLALVREMSSGTELCASSI